MHTVDNLFAKDLSKNRTLSRHSSSPDQAVGKGSWGHERMIAEWSAVGREWGVKPEPWGVGQQQRPKVFQQEREFSQVNMFTKKVCHVAALMTGTWFLGSWRLLNSSITLISRSASGTGLGMYRLTLPVFRNASICSFEYLSSSSNAALSNLRSEAILLSRLFQSYKPVMHVLQWRSQLRQGLAEDNPLTNDLAHLVHDGVVPR
ncbi:MAG: hypothetical protein FRX49_07433 [Trebouxia sp. A1-2]|nr:MAG: hypothetical protein FRX49_07433 [Trebouxia sp. A1-2]